MAVSDSLIDTLFDGRYRIVRKLGAGGMADVYLAEDQELGRRVAIKILNGRHANDDQFIERFRREAKNAAALNHPNIVSIYDRGEAEDTYYIAMEYLDGRTLKELIVGRGAGAGQRRDRVRAPDPLGAALRAPARDRPPRHQAAQRPRRPRGPRQGDRLRHRARRDEPDDRGGLDRRHGAVPLARAGARRRGRPALRPLLARHRPLRAADRADAVRRRHAGRDRDEAPLDHAAEAALQLRPDVPPDLDMVVMRALAKDPDDRYQSADEMEADLERVARGAPVSATTIDTATQIIRVALRSCRSRRPRRR